MYVAIRSTERQRTGQPRRFAWCKAVPNFIWITLLAISGVMNPTLLNAQTSYGSVVGTITDAGGALLSGAQVQLTNNGTNAEQKAVTGSAGTYTFINLVPGAYTVTVSHSGFKASTTNQVDVQIGGITRSDFKLEVGAVTESIYRNGSGIRYPDR
jgi:hypothetical protein